MLEFGKLANTSGISTGAKMLKPWNIYKVKFAGCKVETIQGKKDPDKTYTILKIRFESENGYYEESVFFPQESDAVRPTRTNKEGHEIEMPSNFERTTTLIAQLANTLNPEGFKKMQAASSKFKSFNDVCKALIQITDPKKGVETNLKLIGRADKAGVIKAALPYFVSLNKDGEVWTSDNFIGDKLDFTDYEIKQKNAYESAKPTAMDDKPKKPAVDLSNIPDTSEVPDDDDIDLDAIEV